MRVAAIDTGKTTGVALLESSGEVQETLTFTDLFNNPDEQLRFVRWLTEAEPSKVVVEKIIGSGPRDRWIVDAIQIAAWVKGVSAVVLPTAVVLFQTPQARKPFLRQAAQLLGFDPDRYSKPQSHRVDALAHGLRYLHKNPTEDCPDNWEDHYRNPNSCAVDLKAREVNGL